MKLWCVLIGLSLGVALGGVSAQETNTVTQSNRLRTLQNLVHQGIVEMTDFKGGGEHWALAMGSGVAYTTNANLTSGNAKGDFYLTNTLGVRRQANLNEGFAISTGVEFTDYRYMRYPRLSMSFLDWDMLLSWSGKAAGMDAQGYLSHTLEWTQQRKLRVQTYSSIIALGGSLSKKIAAGHEVSVGSEVSVTPYTSPSSNGYGCLSISADYDWTLAPSVALRLSVLAYETAYFGGERDFSASSSVMLTWTIAPWLSAYGYATPGWNVSTTKGSSYNVVDVGINVSGGWKF